jgi:hypothetical protein
MPTVVMPTPIATLSPKTVAMAPMHTAVAHAPAVPAIFMVLYLLGHCRVFAWQGCSNRCCRAKAQSEGADQKTSMVVEHLVNIGRRNAIERTAHFFLELAERRKLLR